MARASTAAKMTAQTRQSNNVPVAKRAALQFFASITLILRHRDEHYETTDIGRSLYDARYVFGAWNRAFPTTLQLRGLARELQESADEEDPESVNHVLLSAMAEVCLIVGKTASPTDAVRRIVETHGVMLSRAHHASYDGWFLAFGRARTREFNKLVSQLR